MKSSNQLEILILQHPQEKSKDLATAPLVIQTLEKSQVRVGLSWSNLTKALGRPADPKKWGVLFVGSKASTQNVKPVAPDERLEGIIVLDGNWSQAKALWWRNPWLLKLRRIVLQPKGPSLYNKLRREPRKNCISTVESVFTALELYGQADDKQAAAVLQKNFEAFIEEKTARSQSPHLPLLSGSSEES